MSQVRLRPLAGLLGIGALLLSACAQVPTPAPQQPPAQPPAEGGAATQAPQPAATEEFRVGMVIVGPMNDKGWNESHVEGTKYVMAKMPNVKFDYVDKVNPGDRPNVKGSQVADDLIARGAKLIIFNSDDFKDDALETAKKHPNIPVVHVSGDYAWKEGRNYKNQPNLINFMVKMEPGWMIAGCASALETENGKIGTLGPLINEETRRYANAAYLGARYCWENYRKRDPKELQFKVTWIGFWFNIPGVTLDPTKVADDFYNSGFDVVMSAIDTPEAAVQGRKAADAGKKVKYHHYDFKGGCELAPEICIGVHYYNWGPGYLKIIQSAMQGQIGETWIWAEGNLKDLNNPDTSAFGYIKGKALRPENASLLDEFIKGLADGSIDLWKGPLNFQDGTVFLKEGERATDQQIWYMPQLLEGMEGQSVPTS
ncbi:MAG: BMP family ABC transporter substrate-binding protein [Anaerolineae bacterium]|nr:BMP family ABC transporter substrate-binding protein [Thermoflexales bacterium]MDW8053032.1 BMP family ABC transporter substrate-binding protein [Anaerolineae bacterium]